MEYQKLKSEVRKHDKLYYVDAKPVITDAEYDVLYDALEQAEKAQGYRDYDSPTVKVGAIDHRQGKVKHPNRLYSLSKVYDVKEVPKEFDIDTPKLDGACVAIHIDHGKLIAILSRGDGEYGENITPLFKNQVAYSTDFTHLTDYGVVTIVCEAVTFQKVDNYRNYVAGALNLKDVEEFNKRQIELVIHEVYGLEGLPYTARINKVCGFMKTVIHDKEILKAIPQDGTVYRTNDPNLEEKLGYTSKYPKFAVALKTRATEVATTVLKDVIWSVGRTGMVNPTGIVEPVIIGGATVSRLTLHNIAFIEDNDIAIGDKIQIERAGEIIPTYVNTVEKSKVRIPITQQSAEEGIENKVIRTGPRLFVADKSVNDEKVLLNFVTHLNIQGLGPASIKKMGLTHISDLYKPLDWSSIGVNGKKIAQEIEYSKTKAYENVLAGLGIPSVGSSLAKKIIQHIPKFENLYQIEYEKIDKIGPKITEKILTWLDENYEWVIKLPVQLEQTIVNEGPKKLICITGTLDRTRKELTTILEEKGFEVKDSVTKKTYALITDGKIQSDKTEKADKYKIQIINYFERKEQVLEGNF